MRYITEEELATERTPSELLAWIESKFDELGSTEEGTEALRLRVGLAKPLAEEVWPLAVFARKKYGDVTCVGIRPVIGSQNHDAIITDYSVSPPAVCYVEVTLAHRGEEEHLRMLHLQEHGYAPLTGPVQKSGTKKKGLRVSLGYEARSLPEDAVRELGRVLDAISRKEHKDYPGDTSLIVWFDDMYVDRHVVPGESVDEFICSRVAGLELSFTDLYLVGKLRVVFRRYSLLDRAVRVVATEDRWPRPGR